MKKKGQGTHSLVLSLTTTRRQQRGAEPNVPLRLGDSSRGIAASFQADAPDFEIQNTH